MPAGARVFTQIDDISHLLAMTIKQPLAFEILKLAWFNMGVVAENKALLRNKIDTTLQSLMSNITGSRATISLTTLRFLTDLLGSLNEEVCVYSTGRFSHRQIHASKILTTT